MRLSRRFALTGVIAAMLSAVLIQMVPADEPGSAPAPSIADVLSSAPGRNATPNKVWPSSSPLPRGEIQVDTITPMTRSRELIENALDSIVTIEFPGNPLGDVIDFLSRQHGIPVLLDVRAAADKGIATADEVHCVLDGVTLRSALDLMLREIGLTAVVDKDVLLITTPSTAAGILETRVYDVRALDVQDPQALVDVIRAAVPDSWAPRIVTTKEGTQTIQTQVPGPQISYLRGSIVIRQTEAAHHEIGAVLNVLARQVKEHPDSPHWPASSSATNGTGATSGMGQPGGGMGYF